MPSDRVHITAYGCQMNRLDAELVAGLLARAGAEIVDDPAEATVLLVLTCAVREHAENRVFSNLGALRDRKRRQPDLVVGLLGCMAQEHGAAVFERCPTVDLVCAPGRLADLPDVLAEAQAGGRAVALDPTRKDAGAEAFGAPDAALDRSPCARRSGTAGPGAAYVRAMRGCDAFCTYCIVPHVRGPERSRPPARVLDDVRRAVDAGARHVTLLGQAVNKYACRDDGRTWRLADLVAAAADVPGLARLGFITSHPAAMTDRLAAAFRDVPRLMPYLHMPAQAGADAVLARMNRGYTAREYAERVAAVRAARPEVAVASDFIVGFPGETEADFGATCDLVRDVRPAGAFVFKYSPRPGTQAATWADDVSAAEKRRRNQGLLDLVGEIAAEENAKLVGREVELLVEGPSPRPQLDAPSDGTGASEPQLRGRTPCHRLVCFRGPATLAGDLVTVRVTRAAGLTLFGERTAPGR